MRSIPSALDEAATIDGASRLRIFWSIIFPACTPIIIYVMINQFFGQLERLFLAAYLCKRRGIVYARSRYLHALYVHDRKPVFQCKNGCGRAYVYSAHYRIFVYAEAAYKRRGYDGTERLKRLFNKTIVSGVFL